MPEIIPNWHPILVHFTVALLSLSVFLYTVTAFMAGSLRDQWLIVARWALWFGAGITLLTAIAGLLAYNSVAHDTASHAAMTEHRNWAISIIILFPLLAGWSAYCVGRNKKLGKGFILVMIIGGLLLLSTAWHGGEVVYRYGLGVMSLPNVDSHQHGGGEAGGAHGHADGGADGGAGHDAGSDDGHAHEHDGSSHDGSEMDDSMMDFSDMEEGLGTDGHADEEGQAHSH